MKSNGWPPLLALFIANAVLGGVLWWGMGWSSSTREIANISGLTWGSGYHVTLHGSYTSADLSTLTDAIQHSLSDADRKLSPLIVTSEPSQLACASPSTPFVIDDDFSTLIGHLLSAANMTHGRFDPFTHIPPERCSSYLFLNRGKGASNPLLEERPSSKVMLYFGRMVLPMGGIGLKLQAGLDALQITHVSRLLTEQGHNRFRIEIGGEIFVSEGKWPIALQQGDYLELHHEALIHDINASGDQFWMVAPDALTAALGKHALASLTTQEGYQLALSKGWGVRWYLAHERSLSTATFSEVYRRARNT